MLELDSPLLPNDGLTDTFLKALFELNFYKGEKNGV